MKRFSIFFALIALPLLSIPATADVVVVDFASLGIETVDLTLSDNPPGWTGYSTPDGLSFLYDNPDSNGEFAYISSTGVFGTTGQALSLDFSPTMGGLARELTVDFALLGVTEPVGAGLAVIFDNGQIAFADANQFDADQGIAYGTLAYQGRSFGQASLHFAPASYFDVSGVSYTSVPEPSALMLLIPGLAGIIFYRRNAVKI